ncbi:hypothetical protein IAT40_000834 [Kwoniella sp. CBS 6097]
MGVCRFHLPTKQEGVQLYNSGSSGCRENRGNCRRGNSTLQPSAEARQGMNVQSFSSQLSSTGASRNADIAGNPTAVTSFPDLVTKVVPYVKPIIIAFDNDRAKRRAGTEQVRFRTHHFEARLSRGPDAGEWTIDATEVPPDIATLRKAGLKAAANGTCTYNGSSKDGDSAAEKEKCTRNFQEAVSSKGKTLDGYLNDDTDHRLVADYGDQNTSLLCVHDAFASGLKQSSRLNRRGKQVKPSWIEIERRDLSEHGASAQSVSADPNSSAGVISDHPGAFRMANIRRFNEDQSDYLRDPDYLAQLNLSKRLFSAWPPENVETTATWHDGDLAAEVGPPSNYYWHRKDRGKSSNLTELNGMALKLSASHSRCVLLA